MACKTLQVESSIELGVRGKYAYGLPGTEPQPKGNGPNSERNREIRFGARWSMLRSGGRRGISPPKPMTSSRFGRMNCSVGDGKEPNTIGCLQSRILVNGRKVEPATIHIEEGILL
jgi:hypothetical protein